VLEKWTGSRVTTACPSPCCSPRSVHFGQFGGVHVELDAPSGKTDTIHDLASQLPGHTTLIMTSKQVVFISEYFRLARFLELALLIIEDVDLIAWERTHMHGPGEEMLLNKLLNEMDGLREDADVMVILTTNRPDQLEPALASRPGRIDQAIEFPLAGEGGRAKLVRLYARHLDVSARWLT